MDGYYKNIRGGVLRKVFAKYLDGCTPREISKSLNISIYETNRILRDKSLVERKIIPSSLFEIVQEEISKRSKQPNKKYPLVGILFCGKCGAPMVGKKRKYKERTYHQYICKTYADHGRKACPQENQKGKELEGLLLEDLRSQFADARKKVENSGLKASLKVLEVEHKIVDDQIKDLKEKTLQAFINQDLMEADQFEYVMTTLKRKVAELKKKRKAIEEEINSIKSDKDYEMAPFLDLLFGENAEEELSSIFSFFVEKVIVTGKAIDVFYKFN